MTDLRLPDLAIDQALVALGSDESEFYLTARNGDDFASVVLSCRYGDCDWGISVGKMELWEFVVDARRHWDDTHAGPPTASLPNRPTEDR